MLDYKSPLRYPGGKRRLVNFVKLVFEANELVGGKYAEVYAGGGAVALALLYDKYASSIIINDKDPGIYSFWKCACDDTERLCRAISDVKIDMPEWERQKGVANNAEVGGLDMALATFYLNRTNRSGIITGGVIGGKNQNGKWKIDARFNKHKLIERIERIGEWSDHIEVANQDGLKFINSVVNMLPYKSIAYLDPPYYVKGQQMLYANYYEAGDHALVARAIKASQANWIVSYDDVEEIRRLYKGSLSKSYGINYSAQDRYRGREIAFFSDSLVVPDVDNPSRISSKDMAQLQLAFE